MAQNDRSSLVGLVVMAALIVVGGMAFVANFAGQVSKPDREDVAKGGKGKAKAKAKPSAKLPTEKVPEERLVVRGPPIERATAPEGAPNVVLVVLTAVRKDQITPYGGAPEVTPFLARQAGQGARFLDAIAESPFSRASGTAMLTGRHAWNVDMVEPGPKASRKVLPATVPTLAETLRMAGWSTYGATANFNLNMDSGLARGFDVFRNAQPNGFAPGRRLEGQVLTDVAIAHVLEAPDERPFFLQLDYIDAHTPIRVVDSELADFQRDKPNAPYRAALHRIDDELERLHDAVVGAGEADQTLWIYISDSGEGLNDPEHHGALHGRLLYESSMAVPWIVVGPKIPANTLVQGLAAHVDLTPTVLDLVGLPVPEGLDGVSHAAALRGEAPRTSREQVYSGTWHFSALRMASWTSERQCQLDMGSDLPPGQDSFVDACYDRRLDPTFTKVVSDPATMDALRSWYAEISPKITTTLADEGDDGAGEEEGLEEGATP